MINRKHKDTLFADYFGNEKYKENLLSLFNALNNTNYTDVDALEITTIDSVIYMGMKNDVSCIIEGNMSLLEHQSTFNPNMPLRGLIYFGKLYNKLVSPNKEALYRTSLLKIPTPQYFVLYNGSAEQPEYLELHLSDAFVHKDAKHRYEWSAIMLNINPGYNEVLVNSCTALKEYSIFVGKIRQYLRQRLSIEEAVNKTVDECIAENIMKDYLLRNKAGVIDMCLEEFDFEKYKQLVAEDMAELKAALADKDAALARQKKETAAALANKDAEIADKDAALARQKKETAAALADKDAEIAKLKKLLAERNS